GRRAGSLAAAPPPQGSDRPGRVRPESARLNRALSNEVDPSPPPPPASLSRAGPFSLANSSKVGLSGQYCSITHSSGCLRLRYASTRVQPVSLIPCAVSLSVLRNLAHPSPRVRKTASKNGPGAAPFESRY